MVFELINDPIAEFLALVVVGIGIRIKFGGDPTIRFCANLAFFVVLTALLLTHEITPYTADLRSKDLLQRLFAGVGKATWWLGGASVLVSTVRLFLIFEGKPREGRLLQDLIIGLIYIGALLSIVAYVFSVPIGTLIATSGAFAIVLGLAMQSTLADVFSGIALNLGRPYSVGDWIVLADGVQGRVVETNWRATYLLNGTNDLVVMPNSALAKARLVNLTSPDEGHGVVVSTRIIPTKSPLEIEAAMRNVLLSSNAILTTPPPSVTVTDLAADAVTVELAFRVAGLSSVTPAKNEVFDLIYRHSKAAGLSLAVSTGGSGSPSQVDVAAARHPGTPWRLVNTLPLFATLTEDEKETLVDGMKRVTFKKGDVIARQDTALTSLVIVRSGVVTIEEEIGGEITELTRLAPADYFGERGVLMGALEPGTIRALTIVVAYEIPKELLAVVMRNRPAVAEELAVVLSHRDEVEKIHSAKDQLTVQQATSIATRILSLFQIPHGVGERRSRG